MDRSNSEYLVGIIWCAVLLAVLVRLIVQLVALAERL